MATPDQTPGQEPAPPSSQGSGLGVFGLVLGLVALLLALGSMVLPVIGVASGIGALVLGAVGLILGISARKKGATGAATAGVVLSIIALVLGAMGTVCQVMCISAMDKAAKDQGLEGIGDLGAAWGEAMKAPQMLQAAAEEAGHDSFDAWHEADPDAAQAAMERINLEIGDRMRGRMKMPPAGDDEEGAE